MAGLIATTFDPHLDTAFRVVDDPAEGAVVLRLTEVARAGRQPDAPRVEPFSLIFTGPPRPILDQRIYRLEHADLGVLDIFLVPIGYDASGSVRYEAVFN